VLTRPDPHSLLIERLRETLRAGAHVRLAVLFGSAASGNLRAESDIDIAILEGESALRESDELALERELALAGRKEVHLVRLEGASTLLKWQVATKGVPLVEASPGEFARFRARAAAEYIEFAPALAHHGETFRRRLIAQGGGR